MAECRELSEGVASLTVDGSTATVEPLVPNKPGGTNDNTTQRVDTEPRKPLLEKYPNSLTVSSCPETKITGMFLTANNKLWVKYKPPGAHMEYLKLFGDDGQELGLWQGGVVPEGSLTCVDNTLLSLHNWRWIKPSGESGRLDNAPNQRALCSKSISPPYVILYDEGGYARTTHTSSLHRLDVISVDPLKVELVAVCQRTFSPMVKPTGFDVSSCGTLLCVLSGQYVEIFCLDSSLNSPTITKQVTGDSSNIKIPSYFLKGVINSSRLQFEDACFSAHYGKHVLIASVKYYYSDNPTFSFSDKCTELALVLDHDDGFRIHRSIPTGRNCTKVTAHGPGGRLWLGCNGGEILVHNLS